MDYTESNYWFQSFGEFLSFLEELCLVEHDKDNFNRNRVDPCSTQRKLHIHLKYLSFSVCLYLFPKRFVEGFINLVEE